MYFIGVDGGGTKTAAILSDLEGNIVRRTRAGSGNITMFGSIALAIFAIDAVGGIDGLKTSLAASYGNDHTVLDFLPRIGDTPDGGVSGALWMPISAFLVYLAMNWWAAWYPGAEPGGGGYVAQRMFSAKDEKHSLLATLWFNIAHYALRPWPWILVALSSLVLYPDLEDKQVGYIMVLLDHLPTGFKGLLLASFAAAFMTPEEISAYQNELEDRLGIPVVQPISEGVDRLVPVIREFLANHPDPLPRKPGGYSDHPDY